MSATVTSRTWPETEERLGGAGGSGGPPFTPLPRTSFSPAAGRAAKVRPPASTVRYSGLHHLPPTGGCKVVKDDEEEAAGERARSVSAGAGGPLVLARPAAARARRAAEARRIVCCGVCLHYPKARAHAHAVYVSGTGVDDGMCVCGRREAGPRAFAHICLGV